MGNYLVGAILLLVVLLALRSTLKHFRGEGSCCGGGGGEPKTKKKKLQDSIVAKKLVHIEGMRCENCRNHVEQALNQLDGVSAKVNLKKNAAVISMSCEVDDETLRSAVRSAGYQAAEIEMLEA